MSKVLAIIPARGGSKRVPRKNVRLLGGKPLILWALEAASNASLIDRLVVSSDDDDVLQVTEAFGSECALRRPGSMAADASPAIDYVKHALEQFEEHFTHFVIVQPTTPFMRAQDIDATIRLALESYADSAVSVSEIIQDYHPVKAKLLKGDRLYPYVEEEAGRMAYQDLPKVYSRNGGAYCSKVEILNSGQVLGPDCRGYVMPRELSVDINTELDLAFAEFLVQTSRISLGN